MYTFTEGAPGDPFYFGARLNDDNPDYIDMILEANIEGWVAIGFSATQNMVRLLLGSLVHSLWEVSCSVGPFVAYFLVIIILAHYISFQ